MHEKQAGSVCRVAGVVWAAGCGTSRESGEKLLPTLERLHSSPILST